MLVLDTLVLPGTSCQFGTVRLVSCWRVQPVWSTGQESVNVLPLTLKVILVGFGLTVEVEATEMEPLSEILFVQKSSGAGSTGRFVATKPPVKAWLNSWKVSPATRLVGPILVTVRTIEPPLTN